MADRDDVQDIEDSKLQAELERLIDDQITLPLSALCNQLASGKDSYTQVRSFRVLLTKSIAMAIRSAVRPLEGRISALEGDNTGILTTKDV